MPVVSVLWGLGLLTAIATSLLWYGNVSYSLAHNDLEMASINVTVEAGVNRAIDALLDPRPDRRWRTDGATQRFEFNGASIKVSVQDELGKIDLNQADAPLLARLLQSAGLDPDSASNLAANVVDWRAATAL